MFKLSEHTLQNAILPEGFSTIELPVNVDAIRSIISIDQHRCLVLERQGSTGNVVLLYDDGTDEDEDGDIPENPKPSFGSYCGKMCSSKMNITGIFNQRRIVVSASGVNHGFAIHDNYLYASSSSHVYRWPYDPFEAQVTGEVQTVIENINAIDETSSGAPAGQHSTRTLIFDDQDRLLVSVGSIGNVDINEFRARIRRFAIPLNGDSSGFPFNYATGEIFADGLRNEVGLEWDRHGILWGVQTGPDQLNRADLGGAIISEDNPAELLHAFRREGLHYGYPYCWMEYSLPNGSGLGPGTMWTWPTFMGTVTDNKCRDTNFYTPAELPMQGHSSPLGLTFYEYKQEMELATGCSGAFPHWMDGYAFIAFHGSWNRQIPTGYKVVYVPIEDGQVAADAAIDLLAHSGSGAKWPDGFRPVDVDFDECGRLLVTSDGTSGQGTKVVRIDYNQARGTSSGRLYNDPSNRHRDLTATSSGSFLFHCGHHSLMLSAFIFLIVARGIIF